MIYLLCCLLSFVLFASEYDDNDPLQVKKMEHIMPNALDPFVEKIELEHATVFRFAPGVSLDTFDEASLSLVQAAVTYPKPQVKSLVLSPTVYLHYKWGSIFKDLREAHDRLCNLDYISFSGSDLSLNNLRDLFVIYQAFTSRERSPVFEIGQTPAAQEVSEGFMSEFLAHHKEEGQAFFKKVVFE
jgi:hypothetical protein